MLCLVSEDVSVFLLCEISSLQFAVLELLVVPVVGTVHQLHLAMPVHSGCYILL